MLRCLCIDEHSHFHVCVARISFGNSNRTCHNYICHFVIVTDTTVLPPMIFSQIQIPDADSFTVIYCFLFTDWKSMIIDQNNNEIQILIFIRPSETSTLRVIRLRGRRRRYFRCLKPWSRSSSSLMADAKSINSKHCRADLTTKECLRTYRLSSESSS